jgi:hypothetical protein
MRNLILGVLLLLSTLSFSQNTKPIWFGAVGISNYNTDAKKSSNTGFGFSMTMWNVYVEINSNWSFGSGNYLDFQSSQSYNTGKLSIMTINGGYSFNALEDKIILTPMIGYSSTTEIWEDPIGATTNFNGPSKSYVNLGGIVQGKVSKVVYPYVGYGTFDGLKFGVSFKLN